MNYLQVVQLFRRTSRWSVLNRRQHGAPWLFKLHMMMGMTLFVIFPFTRLVHVWSGFASVTYLIRPWQLVRKR
jgi:nitrate reductase gamma subunit